MNERTQIASFIVRSLPQHAPGIAKRITAVRGAEIHAVERGKIIVVVEADCDSALAASMDEMRSFEGVLAVSLVYHYAEPAPT